jgi:CheY-like chemotaxis protein
LILPAGNSPVLIGVTVDEVIDAMELIVKPLATYLQRPGVTYAAIDGRGSILLFLDLPELIQQYMLHGQRASASVPDPVQVPRSADTPTVLVADDSVSMRQSLRQTLSWAHYTVLEARDGMIALEQLLEYLPDVLLLDIEMPNLNGYDLLRAMRSYPQLARVKTIILTSRSSDKHIDQARELGVQLYLMKPVAPDVLLSTIKSQLASS